MFRGVIAAFGGNSATSEYGSPGTVYIQTNIGDVEYSLLVVDNLNRDEKFQLPLYERRSKKYTFNEIKLLKNAVVALLKVLDFCLRQIIRQYVNKQTFIQCIQYAS